jgi:hypothetical protein
MHPQDLNSSQKDAPQEKGKKEEESYFSNSEVSGKENGKVKQNKEDYQEKSKDGDDTMV